ncbi:flavin reductase family protein [Amnibacterium endophyticum]|uniref:Flavin reductase family protein n=1 Tax=Amnibacterium endophyticum TaxID=2109337 RepID=A0ABW4LAL8_9MICO
MSDEPGATRRFEPSEQDARAFSSLLKAVVVPRPIAWVSTVGADGTRNLAPHSFFTIASVDPPVVQFTSVGEKDTLRNVLATGEFVVNLAPADLTEQVNATSAPVPSDVDEFALAGVEAAPSTAVAPPRVAESPVALECVLHGTVPVGDCTLVLGRVVAAEVHESVLADDDLPAIADLAPLARLGRDEWSRIGEVFTLRRPARPAPPA